jgi:preprotein translocase subunit SecE
LTEIRSGGAPATRERAAKPAAGRGAGRSRNPINRASLYSRESYAELRKAVWPTRTELFTYTTVVVVFVAFVIALVYALDLGFSKLVFEIFG